MVDLSKYVTKALTETDRVMSVPLVEQREGALEWARSSFVIGTWDLRQAQADALFEMSRSGGFIGLLGVGHGKTLISYLAPTALGVKRAVIMMPKRDVDGFKREMAKYQDQFATNDAKVTLVPYSTLSLPTSSALLDELEPEAIICDEAHCLGDVNSVRTKRFMRYMEERPHVKFVGMSGTLYKKSVADVAHLLWLALRQGSPVPRPGSQDLTTWSTVLDVNGIAMDNEYRWFESKVVMPLDIRGVSGRVSRCRTAAHKRLVMSPGVVATESASCDRALSIVRRSIEIPEKLRGLIERVRASGASPDGDDVYETTAVLTGAARNISCGFYYQWDWGPGGRNEEWIAARSAWNRALAMELAQNCRTGYDSPALVGDTLDRDLLDDPKLADRRHIAWARARWNSYRHIPEPPRKTVWLDKYLIDLALEQRGDKILWYDSIAFGTELASRGVPVYGAGTDLTGPERWLAASVGAHGTGRNLQDWNRALVLEPGFGGAVWEQLLGRLHRGGQARDVAFEVWLNDEFESAWATAHRDAEFIRDMTGAPQRLLTASPSTTYS